MKEKKKQKIIQKNCYCYLIKKKIKTEKHKKSKIKIDAMNGRKNYKKKLKFYCLIVFQDEMNLGLEGRLRYVGTKNKSQVKLERKLEETCKRSSWTARIQEKLLENVTQKEKEKLLELQESQENVQKLQ